MKKQSQLEKLLKLLLDKKPHSTVEILKKVYGADHLGLARVGARIWELRKEGYKIGGRKHPIKQSVYIYQMV
jgi:biotin operon repressor